MQPDTVIPDLSNPQSWNRYSYVTNRPVNFNDPTGHESKGQCSYYGVCPPGLYLIGSKKDNQRVVDALNNGLNGFTVSVDNHGGMSIKQTGDATSQTPSQKAMFAYLNKIINSDSHMEIKVVSGTDDIDVDNFEKGTLDIQDIEAFGNGPGVTSSSALIHSFEEQYQKQVRDVISYSDAHSKYAIPAEEAVASAIRAEKINLKKKFDQVFYKYSDGSVVTTTIRVNPFSVSKSGCAPTTKSCY